MSVMLIVSGNSESFARIGEAAMFNSFFSASPAGVQPLMSFAPMRCLLFQRDSVKNLACENT